MKNSLIEDTVASAFDRDRKNELIFISVNFAKAAPAKSWEIASVPEQATSSAYHRRKIRANTKAQEDEDDGLR